LKALPESHNSLKRRLVAVGNSLLYPILAIILLGVIWEPVSKYVSVGFIPSPRQVLDALGTNAQHLETYKTLLITFRRIVISFAFSSALGIGLGVAMGLRKWFQQFSLPYIVVMLAIPGPVYIIMTLLILGVNEVSALLALILSVTPFVTTIVYQGTVARSSDLDAMTTHYRIRGFARLWHSIIPQITPSILTGTRTSFALSWKLVVLMEALSRPDGVGAAINHAFKLLAPADVISYTTMFMIVMFLVEYVGFKPMQTYLLRWQSQLK
jgi:ABC-type nitrate/sulfonate/bicarbonate transport system permease component